MPSSDSPAAPEPIEPVKSKPETADPAASPSQNKPAGGKAAKSKDTPAATGEGAKLSPAELKKKAKEEKAARRAAAVQNKQSSEVSTPVSAIPGQKGEGAKGGKGQQKKGGPSPTDARNVPIRGGPSRSAPVAPELPKAEDKTVEFFRHLYKPRTTSIAGSTKDVHPAVLALGLQMSNYTICGSCARLVATLQAFKRVSTKYGMLFGLESLLEYPSFVIF
ncbi:translation initiation factor eif-2b delta subunit protein [Rutstroemia sp. NJR-2017a BVV2]|nr:translation initiation factor eif-2b delta subunit protein [Rutstroemia sp. NJR-2017a BVV2]